MLIFKYEKDTSNTNELYWLSGRCVGLYDGYYELGIHTVSSSENSYIGNLLKNQLTKNA